MFCMLDLGPNPVQLSITNATTVQHEGLHDSPLHEMQLTSSLHNWISAGKLDRTGCSLSLLSILDKEFWENTSSCPLANIDDDRKLVVKLGESTLNSYCGRGECSQWKNLLRR